MQPGTPILHTPVPHFMTSNTVRDLVVVVVDELEVVEELEVVVILVSSRILVVCSDASIGGPMPVF